MMCLVCNLNIAKNFSLLKTSCVIKQYPITMPNGPHVMVRIVHSLSLYGDLRATATWRATPALRGTIDPGRVNHPGQAKGRVQTNLDPLDHNTFLGNRPPTPPLSQH